MSTSTIDKTRREVPLNRIADIYRDNSDIFDSLKSSLDRLEPENSAPSWGIVYNKNAGAKDPEFKSNLTDDFNHVDKVLNSVFEKGHDSKGRIDEKLRTSIKNIVLLIQRKNAQLGIEPYSKQEITILVGEMWHTDHLHGHRIRDDGTVYSREHLFGAVENAIVYQSITDLDILLALLRHDDYEDLEEHSPKHKQELLFYEEAYNLLLQELGEDLSELKSTFRLLRRKTHRRVEGVTKLTSSKLPEVDFELKTKLDIRQWFVEVMTEVSVALIKLCDKLHNTKTLKGKAGKKPERADLTAYLAVKVYAAIADALRLSLMREALIEAAFAHKNPKALARFVEKREERLIKHLPQRRGLNVKPTSAQEAFEGSLLSEKLRSLGSSNEQRSYGISSIVFSPKSFGLCAKPGDDVKDTAYDPFNKDIDPMDSMFEVVVTTDTAGDIQRVVEKIISTFKRDRVTGQVDVELEEIPPVVHPNEGSLIKIFDPVLGGRVWIRVIDKQTQALRSRGIFASMDEHGYTGNIKHIKKLNSVSEESKKKRWVDSKTNREVIIDSKVDDIEPSKLVRAGHGVWQTSDGVPVQIKYKDGSRRLNRFRDYHTPDLLRAAISEVVEATVSGDELPKIFELASKEVFRDSIIVYTRDNEPISIPRGSNVADFAAVVYKGVLAKYAGASRRSKKHGPSEEVNFYDILRDKDTVEILTNEDAQPDLGWASNGMVHSHTRMVLRKIFDESSSEDAKARGLEYLGRLCVLLNIRDEHGQPMLEDLIKFLLSKNKETSDREEFIEKVGTADIVPLDILGKALNISSANGLRVIVEAPDVPDILAQLAHEFGRDGINIGGRSMKFENNPDEPGKILVRINIMSQDPSKITVMNMLTCILRVSYKYPTRISNYSVRAIIQGETTEEPAH